MFIYLNAVFNTDSNHSIIQTYNFTTYKLCDYEDAQENDTIQWSISDPSATTLNSVTVPVPLVKEGMTYFFSSDYDGEQCKNGQHFKVNVTHGQGLPKSLENHPSEESPGPISPNSGDEESAPDTTVPSNFNNPHQESDDKEASGSVSLSMYWKLRDRTMIVILVFLGLVCLL